MQDEDLKPINSVRMLSFFAIFKVSTEILLNIQTAEKFCCVD